MTRGSTVRTGAPFILALSLLALGISGSWSTVLAATDPGLSTAANFAVLGGSTVTNTGSSVVNGDMGVAPGTAITGIPPLVLNGTQHKNDAVAGQAQLDLITAYNAAASQPPTQDLTGQDLGGKVLIPGVYRFSSSAQLTGALTLDGQGATNAVFIFQIGSTLTTASAASVSVINGASACDAWWQIGSSATLGTGTTFRGNLMALTSITLTTGTNIPAGRALARNGAVTMDTNTISTPIGCGLSSSPSPVVAAPSPSGTPSPSGSLVVPPGPSPLPNALPVGPSGSQGGPPPGVAPSPRAPITGAPPDISTPNTGLGLMNRFIVIAALILVGTLMLITARRGTRRSPPGRSRG